MLEQQNENKMLDTIKIILLPKDVGRRWDIEEIKGRLKPVEKRNRGGYRPLGRIKNIYVYGNDEVLKIEGSLAKYFNANNVENFNWNYVRSAINLLSNELGLPLENGRLGRIDVGVNIGLNYDVLYYFPELFHLEYYQRITKHTTSLRFENNSHRVNFLFYDKLKYHIKKDKLKRDANLSHLTKEKNLMRVELQVQGRVSQMLGVGNLRVSDLFNPDFCKLLMKKWFDLYQSIYKKFIPDYPKKFKGNADFEKFIKRYVVEILGWENLNFIMKKAVKQKSLSPSDKSKKLRQFRLVMLDDSKFEFQDYTLELNHKIKVMYVEGLKQIFKWKYLLSEETVK